MDTAADSGGSVFGEGISVGSYDGFEGIGGYTVVDIAITYISWNHEALRKTGAILFLSRR